MTYNGSEFRSHQFGETVAVLGAQQRFIQGGRPQTSGCGARSCRNAGSLPLHDPEADRSEDRPGSIPTVLQLRSCPHRQLGPRACRRTPESVVGKAKIWARRSARCVATSLKQDCACRSGDPSANPGTNAVSFASAGQDSSNYRAAAQSRNRADSLIRRIRSICRSHHGVRRPP